MAKIITRTLHYDKPTITLSLVDGGTLSPNTTYYYRAMTTDHYQSTSMSARSAVSDVQSITTDDTHLSVQIDIAHSTGNDEYAVIWVHEGSDPGVGNWMDIDAFPNVYSLTVAGSTIKSVIQTPTSTYIDDGTRQSNTMLGVSNYSMWYLTENAQDCIHVSGGTELDPVTLEDIYAEAISQGWDLDATVRLVDLGREGAGELGDRHSGYGDSKRFWIVNLARFIVDDGHFKLSDCIVYNFSYQWNFLSGSYFLSGDYDSALDKTHNEVTVVSVGHGTLFCSFIANNAKLYATDFIGRSYRSSIATAYGYTFSLQTDSGEYWEVIDCLFTGGFNRGMSISSANSNCLLKRVVNQENRWECNYPYYNSDGVFQVDGWYLNVDGSGPWIRNNSTEDIEFPVYDMRINGNTTYALYATAATIEHSYRTQLNLINSYMSDWMNIYWYINGTFTPGAYVKRSYTFDAHIVDEDGNDLDSVLLIVEDCNGNTVASIVTDASGRTSQQVITTHLYEANPNAAGSEPQSADYITEYNPFKLYISKDGYENYACDLVISDAIKENFSLRKYRTIRHTSDGEAIAADPSKGSDSFVVKI